MRTRLTDRGAGPFLNVHDPTGGLLFREHVGPGISAVRMPAAISKLGDQ